MPVATPTPIAERRELTRAARPGLFGRAARLSDDGLVVALGVVAATVGLVGFFLVASLVGPDVWVPVVLLLVLTAVSVPMCFAVSGRPIDPRLRKILLVAFSLKMLCTFPRYLMNEVAYQGNADAKMYHEAGRILREHMITDGQWSIEGSAADMFPDETKATGFFTGAIYLVTGASQIAGYLVFTWLCWLGLLAVFRAFQVSYPNAPPYRAAMLIFFLPSTLYWPSSIGKDALMVFGIGLVTLGLARFMAGQRVLMGLVWLVIGAAPVLVVRPHLLLIAMVGAAVSLIARNSSAVATRRGVLGRAALLLALIPVLFVGLNRMDAVFGSTKDGGNFAVSTTLTQTSEQTSVGGSAFETKPVRSPLDLPGAVTNVLYRPFLFEARSAPAFVSAIEGTLLLALTIIGIRWLWRIGPAMAQHPFAAFCGGYVLAFVFAFSNVGNAGILARQRVQMFPLLMVLVAAALEHRRLNAEAPRADRYLAIATSAPSGTSEPRLVSLP